MVPAYLDLNVSQLVPKLSLRMRKLKNGYLLYFTYLLTTYIGFDRQIIYLKSVLDA
jgi:hypothetical protein